MAAAGWEPLPGAVLAHPDLLVERYGSQATPRLFYAVHNRGDRAVAYELAIDLALAGIDPKTVAVVERRTGKRPECTTLAHVLVLRSQVGPRATNLFQLTRTGGDVKPDLELTSPLSPQKSALTPLPRFDPERAGSDRFKATMARLNLRPKTAARFLAAYQQAKRQIGSAVAYHLARENVQGDLNKPAVEIANWLAPQFDAIYEAVLPGPAMAQFIALRSNYKDPAAWQLAAAAKRTGDEIQVHVWDPLLEKPPAEPAGK
jgi:hypothetical protein